METAFVHFYFSVLFYLNALIQAIFFIKSKKPFHFYAAGWLFVAGCVLFYWFLFASNLLLQYPFLAVTYFVMQIMGSPFGLCMIFAIFSPGFIPPLYSILFMIPGALGIIRLGILATDPVFNNSFIKTMYAQKAVNISVDRYVDALFLIHVFVSASAMFWVLIRKLNWKNVWNDSKKPGIVQKVVLYLLSIIVIHVSTVMLIFLVPVLPGLLAFQKYVTLFGAGEVFIISLFFQLMPTYISASLKSIHAPEGYCEKFIRSRLDGVNLNDLNARLNALFDKEEIFMDENLTLDALSKKAGYSSKVVSEFLNSKKKLRFTDLVNQYRMKKAIELLKNNPDVSVTHAAMDAGFNSIPTFYRLFKKETGTSPEKYRSM
ncbi:MAG: helix-turn-helix domain-containing protein [Spirochaetia bacterium]|nr:helix-turn-helix domain-containing protein [Spirochaetia bacterium]